MDSHNFEYRENERNKNDIYTFEMEKDQIKYILGTFNIEEYAYGELKVNYYATIDTGDFELYYRNSISDNETNSLFSMDEKYSKKFNEIITLKTNLDLFVVKCIEKGNMSIRPQYKSFNESTHLIQENSYNKINMLDYTEVVQLSAPISKNSDILYFSVYYLNYIKLLNPNNGEEYITISPDTAGLFENKTLRINEIFKASIDLSKYKPEQLAFYITSNVYNNWIEITEVIQNNYTKYEIIHQGENKGINANNVILPIAIENQSEYINITIENLQNEEIAMGIIKTSENDTNYIATADKYPNSIKKKVRKNIETFYIKNEYFNETNEIEEYLYFIMSILDKKDNFNYNINIEFSDDEVLIPTDTDKSDEGDSTTDSTENYTDTTDSTENYTDIETDTKSDDSTDQIKDDGGDNTTTIIIVSVVVGVVLILGAILLLYHFCKKPNSDEIEKLSALEPSNQLI